MSSRSPVRPTTPRPAPLPPEPDGKAPRLRVPLARVVTPPDGFVGDSLGRAGAAERGRSRSDGRSMVDPGGAGHSGAPVCSEPSAEPVHPKSNSKSGEHAPMSGERRASSRARRTSGSGSADRRSSQQFRDGSPGVGHDVQVILDVPSDWTLPRSRVPGASRRPRCGGPTGIGERAMSGWPDEIRLLREGLDGGPTGPRSQPGLAAPPSPWPHLVRERHHRRGVLRRRTVPIAAVEAAAGGRTPSCQHRRHRPNVRRRGHR